MKRGFTLIELLAVIVILAIIALIAVPIVVNIINDSKKESIQRSIDLYMDTVHKRITQENMKIKYDPDRCDIQDNGNVKCYVGDKVIKTSTGEEELKIEMNGKKPEAGTIRFKTKNTEVNNNNTDANSNKITYTVELEGMEYTLNSEGNKITQPAPIKATGEDYRGYYADVDGDGKPDGIIYADLAHPKEETTWGRNYTNYAKYSYTKGENLNEYTVSNNTYKKNEGFGENKIIKLKKDNKNPRFYVMALEDFTEGSMTVSNLGIYYWYKNASGDMDPLITLNDFRQGKENTRKMIAKWKAEGDPDSPQNNQDIWKHIEGKYQDGWYIPSLGEWTAFADYFTSKEENPLTSDYELGSYVANSGNYNSLYGLSTLYWSSSQNNTNNAWGVNFVSGNMSIYGVYYDLSVRLGATF